MSTYDIILLILLIAVVGSLVFRAASWIVQLLIALLVVGLLIRLVQLIL